MMRLRVKVIIAILLLASCMQAQQHGVTNRSPIVLLRVINAADNATRIPGAEVFAVGDHGALVRLGATNTYGEIKVSRASLPAASDAVAIVVCHPAFFCGALRADYIAPRDEATLALAVAVSD